MGKPVASVPWQPAPGTEGIIASCIYQVRDAPQERVQLDVWRYPSGKEAQAGFEENKSMLVTIFNVEPQMVTGLGEEALWIGSPAERLLAVRQDNLILAVKNTVQAQDAKVEQLVKQRTSYPPSLLTK